MRQSKDSIRPRKARAKGEGVAGTGYSKGLAKREEILVGLMNALAQGELRNPSLRAIGKALGIEPAHILYYFDSREDLLQAVIVRWDEDSLGQHPAKSLNDTDLDRVVITLANNVKRPGIVHLYLAFAAEAVEPSHPAHDFIRQRFASARDSLAGAIRREQEAGTIHADVDAEIEARLIIALADGLQLQSLIDPDIDAVAHIAAAIAQLRVGQ